MYRNMKMVLMLVFFSSIVNGLPVSFDMCCGNITVVSLETFRALWKRPEKLEDIEKLNLEKNIHLEYLNASVFSGFKRLKILELWKTNLNSIDKDAFQGLNNLEKLFLNENLLTDIKPGTFSGLENLRVLDLSYNNLLSIDKNMVSNLTKLEIIYLNDNPSLLKNNLADVKILCKSTKNTKCKLYY